VVQLDVEDELVAGERRRGGGTGANSPLPAVSRLIGRRAMAVLRRRRTTASTWGQPRAGGCAQAGRPPQGIDRGHCPML
jgi:hypothetical protein